MDDVNLVDGGGVDYHLEDKNYSKVDEFKKELQEFDSVPQVEPKVKVKRNRGLKRDILKFIENAPNVSPEVVYGALKDNQYGGSNPVSLGCVMSTMSQIKKKGQEVKVAESLGIEVVKSEPKEQ